MEGLQPCSGKPCVDWLSLMAFKCLSLHSSSGNRLYRVTCIIVDDFECKNKCLPFVATLQVCHCRIRNFIEILYTKFQRCMLLNNFLFHDLLSASVFHHSVCSIITAHKLTAVKRDVNTIISDQRSRFTALV